MKPIYYLNLGSDKLKLLNRIFHEDTIGIAVIGMMLLACVYLYTESSMIQKVGLSYGIFIFVLLIGFLIKIIIELVINLYKYIKSVFK